MTARLGCILLLVVLAWQARAQEVIDSTTLAVIDAIEGELRARGMAADISSASDAEIAAATAGLVTPERSATELADLVRAAVTARPSAFEAILDSSIAAASRQGFSGDAIGAMLDAAIGALEAQGTAADLDGLILARFSGAAEVHRQARSAGCRQSRGPGRGTRRAVRRAAGR